MKALVVFVTVWKVRRMVGKEGNRIEKGYMLVASVVIWKTPCCAALLIKSSMVVMLRVAQSFRHWEL